MKLWEPSWIIFIRMPAKNHIKIRSLGTSTKLMSPQKKGIYLCQMGFWQISYYRGEWLLEKWPLGNFFVDSMGLPPGVFPCFSKLGKASPTHGSHRLRFFPYRKNLNLWLNNSVGTRFSLGRLWRWFLWTLGDLAACIMIPSGVSAW